MIPETIERVSRSTRREWMTTTCKSLAAMLVLSKLTGCSESPTDSSFTTLTSEEREKGIPRDQAQTRLNSLAALKGPLVTGLNALREFMNSYENEKELWFQEPVERVTNLKRDMQGVERALRNSMTDSAFTTEKTRMEELLKKVLAFEGTIETPEIIAAKWRPPSDKEGYKLDWGADNFEAGVIATNLELALEDVQYGLDFDIAEFQESLGEDHGGGGGGHVHIYSGGGGGGSTRATFRSGRPYGAGRFPTLRTAPRVSPRITTGGWGSSSGRFGAGQ